MSLAGRCQPISIFAIGFKFCSDRVPAARELAGAPAVSAGTPGEPIAKAPERINQVDAPHRVAQSHFRPSECLHLILGFRAARRRGGQSRRSAEFVTNGESFSFCRFRVQVAAGSPARPRLASASRAHPTPARGPERKGVPVDYLVRYQQRTGDRRRRVYASLRALQGLPRTLVSRVALDRAIPQTVRGALSGQMEKLFPLLFTGLNMEPPWPAAGTFCSACQERRKWRGASPFKTDPNEALFPCRPARPNRLSAMTNGGHQAGSISARQRWPVINLSPVIRDICGRPEVAALMKPRGPSSAGGQIIVSVADIRLVRPA